MRVCPSLRRNSVPAHCSKILQPWSFLHSLASHLAATSGVLPHTALSGRISPFVDEETEAVVKRPNFWKTAPRFEPLKSRRAKSLLNAKLLQGQKTATSRQYFGKSALSRIGGLLRDLDSEKNVQPKLCSLLFFSAFYY